jgi:HSP20 family protein
MEKSLSVSKRPWWMTPFGREPTGDVWSDRLWPEWSRWQGEEFSPSTNLYEKDGSYHLTAELPGIKKDDVSITIDGNVLTVTGKKESEKEETGKNYYMKESRYGSFSRSFRLPEEVDESKVDASLKDGVLKVSIPVKEGAKSRKVKIKD